MRAVAVLLLSMSLSSSGCARIERTRQCLRVVSTVNAALEEISARQDAGASDPRAEREIAERYEKLDAALDMQLENPALAKSVTEYRELIRDTARLIRRIADAREKKDPITIAVSKRELSTALRREKGIVMRIDSTCESP